MKNKSVMPSQKQTPNQTLIILTGLVAFVFLLNALLALFGLHSANEQHLSNLRRLGDIMQGLETARTAQVHFKKQVQEWKNILLRGQNPQDFKKHSEAFYGDEAAVDQQLQKLQALAEKTGLDIGPVKTLQQTHKELGKRYRSALESYDVQDPKTIFVVDASVRGIDRAPTDALDSIVKMIWQREEQVVLNVQKETLSQYETWRMILIPATIIGILLVFVLLWLSFSRS